MKNITFSNQLAIALVAMIFTCSACKGKTTGDEGQIRSIIADAASRAEKHDAKGVMAVTTEQFVVTPRRIDRKSAKRLLFLAFQRYGEFKLHYPTPTVRVYAAGLLAEAHVPFVIVKDGTSPPGLAELADDPAQWVSHLRDMGDAYDMHISFEKNDKDWMVKKIKVSGTRHINDF